MIDYQKIKNSLSELLGENASNEQLQKLGTITKMVDDAEAETKQMAKDSDELRKMYIDAVKAMPVKQENEPEEPAEEHDLEYYLREEAKKAK